MVREPNLVKHGVPTAPPAPPVPPVPVSTWTPAIPHPPPARTTFAPPAPKPDLPSIQPFRQKSKLRSDQGDADHAQENAGDPWHQPQQQTDHQQHQPQRHPRHRGPPTAGPLAPPVIQFKKTTSRLVLLESQVTPLESAKHTRLLAGTLPMTSPRLPPVARQVRRRFARAAACNVQTALPLSPAPWV